MVVPTRVFRCSECGTKRLGYQVMVTDWICDGDGQPLEPKAVICIDRIDCQEMQSAPPTVPMDEVRDALRSDEDLPF